jgi:hypothetical protein
MAESSLMRGVGIFNAETKLSIALSEIINIIGSASYEIRFDAADINTLTLAHTDLSNSLRAPKRGTSTGEQISSIALLLCRKDGAAL